MRVVDLSGKRFGMLVALRREGTKNTYAAWRVKCDCGIEKIVCGHELRKGRTSSCGCNRLAAMAVAKRTHGMKKSPEYSSWKSMRGRCENPYDSSYSKYGVRGIRVCRRWIKFESFLADMGHRPPKTTIDRVDNAGHYSCGKCDECVAAGWPSNCRWATYEEQGRNKRTNTILSWRGKAQSLSAWAAETGLKRSTISQRLNRGWTIERALSVTI